VNPPRKYLWVTSLSAFLAHPTDPRKAITHGNAMPTIRGSFVFGRPLPDEFGSLWSRTFFLIGNHDTESTGFLNAHRGEAWGHNLHGRRLTFFEAKKTANESKSATRLFKNLPPFCCPDERIFCFPALTRGAPHLRTTKWRYTWVPRCKTNLYKWQNINIFTLS
jgi:hypothetical protein